jgi:hypothetical protein
MERKQSFALLSFVRKNRKTRKGEYLVYLRITVDGKRAEIAAKTHVDIEKWNATRGRLKGTTEEIRRLNHLLDNFEYRAREIYNKYFMEGKIFTAEEIKNEMTGLERKQRTLGEWVEEMELREANGYSKGTIKNWKVTQGHLKQFLKGHYHLTDIAFKQLDYKFIANLEWFARVKWHCGTNVLNYIVQH